jgi:Lon protease-like protein
VNDPTPGVTAPAQSVIPLFPLGTVLFPGVVLPLHIFEPRYRLLVRELMHPRATPEFGVVAIRQGTEGGPPGTTVLYDIGCAAALRQVTPYDDGRFDIVTVGARRFRILEVDPHSQPYLRGRVEWLDESPVEPGETAVVSRSVAELFGRCQALLRAYATTGAGPSAEGSAARTAIGSAALPTDPLLLSHLVAAAAPFTLDDRQNLLSACNTAERLRQELRLLKQEITMISRLRAVPVPLAELRVPMGMN